MGRRIELGTEKELPTFTYKLVWKKGLLKTIFYDRFCRGALYLCEFRGSKPHLSRPGGAAPGGLRQHPARRSERVPLARRNRARGGDRSSDQDKRAAVFGTSRPHFG